MLCQLRSAATRTLYVKLVSEFMARHDVTRETSYIVWDNLLDERLNLMFVQGEHVSGAKHLFFAVRWYLQCHKTELRKANGSL